MVYKLWFTSYGLRAGAYELGQDTETEWCRPGGYTPVVKVFDGTKYIDGEEAAGRDPSERLAAYHRTITIPALKAHPQRLTISPADGAEHQPGGAWPPLGGFDSAVDGTPGLFCMNRILKPCFLKHISSG